MSLEGFNILIGLALAFGGFHSPCDCNPSLVFRISNGGFHTVSFAEASVDAVALIAWIKIRGCQSGGYKIQGVNLGLNSHIDDGLDASIPIRS